MAIGGSIIYEIEADTTKFESSMKSLGQSFTQVGEAGETAGSSFGAKFMAAMQKYDIAGKLKSLFNGALEAGGNLEQSIGGIETLFKDSADIIIERSKTAWKTAGMSANEYMQTATSFSAALIRSLEGDTEKAAAITDRIITDMSDNANKMGTDMEMVQNAYRGFARENYTMLDNLSLGFAGTKQGAKELVEYASTLTDRQEELGITIDKNSLDFANLANAISVVQNEMEISGLTAEAAAQLVENGVLTEEEAFARLGTTAKEASITLQGSQKAMKASFENLLASVALGENVGEALQGVFESTSDYLTNVLRMVGNMAEEVPGVLFTMLERLASEALPALTEMISGIGEGLAEGIPEMLGEVLPKILSLTDMLRENFGTFVDAGLELLVNLAQGIANGLPKLIEYVPLIISNIAGLINDNMPKILEKGWEIIVTLGQGLINAIPTILENMGNIMKAVTDVIKAINWLQLGSNVIEWITNGIKALFNAMPDLLKNIGNTALNFVKSIDWPGLGSGIINFIVGGIRLLITAIPNLLKEIGSNAINFVKSIDWGGLGKSIIDGIVAGIRNFGGAIADTLMGMARNAWNAAKSFLGINSPSRLMRDTIGKNISLGVAEGIDEEADSVSIAATDMFKGIEPEVTLGNINQNITSNLATSDIIAILESYLPQIAAQKEVVLDTGALVGEMTDGINRKMGLIYNGQI